MPGLDMERLVQALAAKVTHLGGAIALALAVFIAVMAAARVIAALLRGVAHRQPRHAALLSMLARATWVTGLIVATLSALQNLGVDVTAFVASLGLLGLTLGFALRDVATSFVAGLLLIVYRPFSPGDHIAVQGVEGRVMTIDLRYTTLAGEGRIHLVPNSTILTNPVTVVAAPVRPNEGGA